MTSLTLPAYAKVNLFLDILRRRPDGYHDLEMINAKITLQDTVTCTLNDKGEIRVYVNQPGIPCDEKNTAFRAAKQFFASHPTAQGVEITLEKHIPTGAGLGGGSSNAAAVLLALNRLTGETMTRSDLVEIGAGIGADVPFFLYEGACHLHGVGERVESLPVRRHERALPWVVLLSPRLEISTKTAYALWDAASPSAHLPSGALIAALRQGAWDHIPQGLYNAFESVIYPAFPELQKVYLDFCSLSPTRPLLSGSGSNLFSVTADQESAERLAEALRDAGYAAAAHQLLL